MSPSQRPTVNRQFVLVSRPVGLPKESDFKLVETPVRELSGGEVLVRAAFLSVDPYMRGRISGMKSYAAPVEIGQMIVGGGVAEVIESKNPEFKPGDFVDIYMGWQEYAISNGKNLRKLDPSIPVSTALGVLGMPGLTAYFGLLDVCGPKPGETVVVSGAAGAVGSLVGQIAKIKRCRAIGIAGSDEKIRFITQELGFDGGFNYRETRDYGAKLKELCPNGIDIYFDNVGGPITDEVIKHINTRARIAVCGQISQYNADQPEMGPRWMGQLIAKQAKVEGFLVMQFADRYEEGLKQLATWLREKKIKYREDVAEGLENAPAAFIGMMQGKNIGKQLVQVWKEGAALTGAARG